MKVNDYIHNEELWENLLMKSLIKWHTTNTIQVDSFMALKQASPVDGGWIMSQFALKGLQENRATKSEMKNDPTAKAAVACRKIRNRGIVDGTIL